MDIDEGLGRVTDGVTKLLELEDAFVDGAVIGVVHGNIFIYLFGAPNLWRDVLTTKVQVLGRVTEGEGIMWRMRAVRVGWPSGRRGGKSSTMGGAPAILSLKANHHNRNRRIGYECGVGQRSKHPRHQSQNWGLRRHTRGKRGSGRSSKAEAAGR